MHEMSLCESAVQIIEDQARIQAFSRVRRVVFEVGTLAAVDADALRFCFDVVAARGVARGATVDIVTVPAHAWCMQCAVAVDIARRGDACPRCGGHQVVVEGGDALKIKELEVD